MEALSCNDQMRRGTVEGVERGIQKFFFSKRKQLNERFETYFPS